MFYPSKMGLKTHFLGVFWGFKGFLPGRYNVELGINGNGSPQISQIKQINGNEVTAARGSASTWDIPQGGVHLL